MTHEFDIGDVLSVATGYALSDRGVDGVHDIVAFMLNTEPGSGTLLAGEQLAAEIIHQHPILGSQMIRNEAKRIVALTAKMPEPARTNAIANWLQSLRTTWRRSFPVARMNA